MAILYYQNVRPLSGGYELTSVAQECTINASRARIDATTMASNGWEESIAGLKSTKASLSGFLDYGTTGATDLAQFAAIGASASDLMILPTGGADASVGFIASAIRGSYEAGGKVGDAAGLGIEWNGTGMASRGTVLKNGIITATGTGTIMQLGAITAGQTAMIQIQTTAVSGTTPSMTVIVQSASLVGFGSPTTRATFSAQTGIGSQTLYISTPVTDQFWRVSYTISGTSPSFTTAIVMGDENN
jgi:hypothetical protein